MSLTKVKKMVFTVIAVIVALYVLVLIILCTFQEKIIFFPEKLSADYPFQVPAPFEERWVRFQNLKINSLLFKVPNSQGLILYFHGNAGSLFGWSQVAEELSHQSHWDVWIMDYPSYGKSEGSVTSETQLHEMAETFWNEARKEYPTAPIVIFGRSVGSGIATKLASTHQPAGLALEAPYFSVLDLARHRFPIIPSFLLRYTFHSDEWLPQVKSPIFITHGTKDEVIPFSQGEKLSQLVKNKEFAVIEGGHHNTLAQYDQYWKSLLSWLSARAH